MARATRPRSRWLAGALAAGLAVLLAAGSGCADRLTDRATGLRLLVPNAPGSGYDVTARTAAKAMADAGVARGVEVFNLPGGGGVVGLRRLGYERGNPHLMMLMGLGVVGSQFASEARFTLQDTTPIARLIEEPAIVVVTRDSPYRDIGGLIAAWRADPASVPVGGGSSAGGPDHLAPMLLADAVGIPPRQVSYRQFDGGGDLLAAILDHQVDFGVSGRSEYADQIASGQLRVLAVTSEFRIPGTAAPTLRERGVDVVFTNWRGIVAPPGLADRDVVAMRDLVARLHGSAEWQAVLAKYGWTDAYLDGAAFGDFLRAENARLAHALDGLGLHPTGPSAAGG
ncbi:tripartite tricarboxylate transporter substrate binding protein [Plantactinospora endophytica]|uniref:C4-dicarboxylate ABC transporter substrate-binding protein n=1 Tax=Plantactinospora endophytica TaxID=673535 RepID=A0ABQ4E8Y3_9ACTN|nr:tripartite tricarboxylate transporter substrate-binding protein [Plantactinospora endophytica]GIG91173.1 C4-dicarboxylate ABC transporter substrate-binding protein [Plantactinospora endophytica]